MALYFDEAWLKEYCRRTGQKAPGVSGGDGAPGKRTKYGNRRAEMDGRTFDSRHEAEVYRELTLAVRAGEHRAVACQVAFPLPGGVRYIADFVTLEADGSYTVWDAKSAATARDRVYRLKKRQMKECLGIEIREV